MTNPLNQKQVPGQERPHSNTCLFSELTCSTAIHNNQLPRFANEAMIDFSIPQNNAEYEKHVEHYLTKSRKPCSVQSIIGGEEVNNGSVLDRRGAGDETSVIATINSATKADVDRALLGLRTSFRDWASTSVEVRSNMLLELSTLIKQNRFELMALIGLEVGKNRFEADAEIAEAVDFCEYYAREALKLGLPTSMMDVAGEENILAYRPRGVVGVIAPWNFPFAIPCGMIGAGLATGNTVAFKPAEQSSLIGQRLVELMFEAGFPKDVLAFLPGPGETVGRSLVESSEVDIIVFTGSKEVGLEIQRVASQVQPGQRNIKRVITELGGKNALIVDNGVDLDKAVPTILASAFGFAGQKCSSLSRLIVVGAQYEVLLEKLGQAARKIKVGSWQDASAVYGPVIEPSSGDRIWSMVEKHSQNLRAVFAGPRDPNQPSIVTPQIFADVPHDNPLWTSEIFGPVLACTRAATFDEAIMIANNSEYALTGGVLSQSAENLRTAHLQFRAGNLYFNRKITGALVGRQPFGGFGMSGIGSKAGGPDYLLQFVDPVALCNKFE